jgi:hypothetical protein
MMIDQDRMISPGDWVKAAGFATVTTTAVIAPDTAAAVTEPQYRLPCVGKSFLKMP